MELRPLLLPSGRQEKLADLRCSSIAMKVPKSRSDRCAVTSDDPDLACRKEYLHVDSKASTVHLSSKVRRYMCLYNLSGMLGLLVQARVLVHWHEHCWRLCHRSQHHVHATRCLDTALEGRAVVSPLMQLQDMKQAAGYRCTSDVTNFAAGTGAPSCGWNACHASLKSRQEARNAVGSGKHLSKMMSYCKDCMTTASE